MAIQPDMGRWRGSDPASTLGDSHRDMGKTHDGIGPRLRQRAVRELLRDAGVRTHPAPLLPDAGRATPCKAFSSSRAAEVRDQQGRPMSGAPVSWTSSDASVAAVAASGVARVVAAGTATITATSGTVSDDARITVRQDVVSVGVSPRVASLVVGDTVRLTAVTERERIRFCFQATASRGSNRNASCSNHLEAVPAPALVERDEELELCSRIQQVPIARILAHRIDVTILRQIRGDTLPSGAIVARDIDVGPQIAALVSVHGGVGRGAVVDPLNGNGEPEAPANSARSVASSARAGESRRLHDSGDRSPFRDRR